LHGLWTFYELQHLPISTVKSTDKFCVLLPRYVLNLYILSSPADVCLSK
jgi:hypothetical protein